MCVSNVELLKLFVLVPKNDNLIPDLTLTILLRCFAAAGILPLSRTAYQGAYIQGVPEGVGPIRCSSAFTRICYLLPYGSPVSDKGCNQSINQSDRT